MRSAPAARALVLLPLLASTTVLLLAALGWQSASVNAFQPPSPTASGSRRRHHRSLLQTPSRSASISHQASSLPSPWALAAQQSSSGGGGGMEGLFRLIRNDALSLAIGSLCLVALVGNRLGTPDLYDSQSRTDIIGVISAGGLLLNGLTLQVRTSCTVYVIGRVSDKSVGRSGGKNTHAHTGRGGAGGGGGGAAGGGGRRGGHQQRGRERAAGGRAAVGGGYVHAGEWVCLRFSI